MEYAKDHGLIVRFSAEDATRTDFSLLKRLYKKAEEYRADYVSIADTVGIMNPRTTFFLVSEIKKVVTIPICMHCHDDLGLAVANSLAGIEVGAGQIECTINGIGERAGNCALEEIVMVLRVRADRMPFDTNVDTPRLYPASRLLSSLIAFGPQPNKAIVGRNAFAHESGIHQDGVLKERTTYEIMDATTIGLESNSLVLGKHSGRAALRDALEEMGYTVDGQTLNTAFKRFKDIADNDAERLSAALGPAPANDRALWGTFTDRYEAHASTYKGEIAYLKGWYQARFKWIDSQLTK